MRLTATPQFLLAAILWFLAGASAQSATFTWTKLAGGNASGSWTAQANWSGATLPTTTNDTVNFNTLDITANSTVTLDGSQSVNAMNFSDTATGTAANWIINAGNPTTSTLTLGGASPTINVTNIASGRAAVINAVIAGTNGLTKIGQGFVQLNGANTYSGGTILSGANCYLSVGNSNAFGTGTVTVGANAGDPQVWFNPAGNQTLTNAFEIRCLRWIIESTTVNGVAAGNLTINGNVLLNTGPGNARDIYCSENLTLNGNVSVTPASNPLNKSAGSTLTLNGTNTVGGASTVSGGTLVVNGPMDGGATFTVATNAALSGTGNFSGPISLANGSSLTVGNGGSGTLTCGGLTSVPGVNFYFSFGATNSATNGLIVVNGNLTLAGTLNLYDSGGLSSGVYTGLQYSGSLTLGSFTNGTIAAGRTILVLTNTPHYVLFDVLDGNLNPNPGQAVPMDQAAPLALGWVQVPDSVAYDVYLGTVSNSVATATTNTAVIYQGRTNGFTMNIASIQPNTTYYWRVDSVAANGAITKGTIYSFTTGAAIVDLMADTWVATDALNRSLPGLADCGSPRTNRPIGIMYTILGSNRTFGDGGNTVTNYDATQYLLAHPYTDPHNPWADNPTFQTSQKTYWATQPVYNYYTTTDPWVLRRHLAMLNAAGVDILFFDESNGQGPAANDYPMILTVCAMIEQMKLEGTPINLKVAFFTHAGSGAEATWLYNTYYGPGLYPDLWYYWQGKPLMIGYVNGSGAGDTVPNSTVQNFFTWRTCWAYVPTNTLQDGWQWVDVPTPQNWSYDTRFDLPEELPVSCGGWANGNLGKSQSNNSQQDYDNYHLPLQRTSGLGIFFKEQMNYGLKYDPQILWVDQWNEWTPGCYSNPSAHYTHLLADWCPANGFYFVDQYNEEYNRNLEPINGGCSDNYYYQLVAQDRLRKGVRPVPPASAPQTIDLAGGFAQWTSVAPSYYDPANDTIWRNYVSASTNQMGSYTNTTGRNDFTMLKVARDANNFYFFAQCNSNITSYTGTNWMTLFIDADQNHATGWNGYDFAVNFGPRTATTTTLSQDATTTNGWSWTTVRSDLAYTVTGNQLMLAIPRASLGLTTDPVSFDFHWADNFQTNDIADFYVDGDSAPDGRFNYRYVTTTNTEVTLLSDDFENGKQSWWGNTWTNGCRWTLTTASPYTGNNCAVGSYATTGQSYLMASNNTAGYGSFRLNFHYKLTNVVDAQNLQISYQTANGWVPIRELSRDEYYPTNQSWSYNEQQNVWLNFTDTRYNSGPDARFFTTNFAWRIDVSTLTAAGQQVFVDAVTLTADTQMPAAVTPGTWQTQDIGNAGNAGSVTNNGNTFTVVGSGLGIGNAAGDACRLLYQTRTGDGTFTARVTGISATSPSALAGVMIRESLDSGARNVLMALTANNTVAFQQRGTALSGTAATVAGSGLTPPYWVRVVRGGTNFTGYYSANGTSWTQAGTTNIAGFNSTALWALAVTANNNNTNNVATFDNVTATQSPVIAAVSNQTLIAGQTLVVSNSIVNPATPPLTLTWATIAAPSGVNLNASSGVMTWRPAIAQSPTTNTISYKVTDGGTPPLSATQSFLATVISPVTPTLSQARATNNIFSMQVNGSSGPDYMVLASTNLTGWSPLWTNYSPVLPFNFTDTPTNSSQRFYRVLLGP